METKRTNVIALLTDDPKPALYRHTTESGVGAFQSYELTDKPTTNMYFEAEGCHLYFINDDEIKVGSFIKCPYGIRQVTVILANGFLCGNDNFGKSSCSKVVATTDKKLLTCNGIKRYGAGCSYNNNCKYPECLIAQPSQAFIEKYCKVDGIKEVVIDYQPITICTNCTSISVCSCNFKYYKNTHRVKVDTTYNTITIHPVKNSYNIEETKALQLEAFEQGRKLTQDNWETEDFKDFEGLTHIN
tara:strand:- start:51601 stop:52332 length:732 start_codon:yes stop_codon:yes gene_type:complete